MFIAFFGGSGIIGMGFDFWWYRKRRAMGCIIMVCGLALSSYAVFWPLLFGGY
jgi:hypothetical protein